MVADGERKVYKRDFWAEANLLYARPHYRLQKAARIIGKIARGRECSLLDVGCGPAALRCQLPQNIRYHGIDIAIQEPSPSLIQADLLESPIKFGDECFDIVLAQGFFEYAGNSQEQKFAEISQILAPNGTFIVSYVNFGHRKPDIAWTYSNVQSVSDFRASLSRYFKVDRSFPTSHNWRHNEPGRPWLRAVNMHFNVNIPYATPILAAEYFFICSAR